MAALVHELYFQKDQHQQMAQEYHFAYNGTLYDATEYADKHPGGLQVLDNMKAIKKDFTQYFRALHSDQAVKVLKSFKIIGQAAPTKESEQYMEIYKKLESYQEPQWGFQVLLFVLLITTWLIGCTSSYPIISVISFGFTQILVGWVGHSCAHNRNKNLILFGRIQSALLGGLSLEWWTPKHNMHHMFTNIQKYDSDIQHEYKTYLFEFLFLKWRFDSLVASLKSVNILQTVLILTNYACLYVFRQNLIWWVVGMLISGFYTAFVLVGNHENEVRYKENPQMSFIDHQIKTCRNYEYENLFWLLMMGGMQYQTEHHLFPQIPFYRLPTVKDIIKGELKKLNKSMIYGPIIDSHN